MLLLCLTDHSTSWCAEEGCARRADSKCGATRHSEGKGTDSALYNVA